MILEFKSNQREYSPPDKSNSTEISFIWYLFSTVLNEIYNFILFFDDSKDFGIEL